MTLKDILRIEMNHIRLFSTGTIKQSGIIFFDERLKDKYYHNYFHITESNWDLNELKAYEIDHKKEGFVNFLFETGDTSFNDFFDGYKKETNAYYQAKIDELSLTPKINPDIKRVDPLHDELFFEFLYQDSMPYGESYAKGNAKRQQEVLSQNLSRYFYMKVTHQHQIIGHLNAHVEGDYAKIDDFSIVDSHQKKGFGTALMKAMLDELKKLHVKEVYLVTDLADTAKELYERMGYKQTGIFYHYIKMFKD